MTDPAPQARLLLRSQRDPASDATSSRPAYDPVQIGWLDAALPDDLDPGTARPRDPLAPLDGDDPLARAGLALHPWRLEDQPAFRALLDDAALWTHLPEPYPDPLDDPMARDLIIASNGLAHHAVRALWRGEAPVGQLRLEYRAQAFEAEISYWLGRAHWGRGLGGQLVRGAVLRAFGNDLSLLRLTAKVHPDNPASRRVLEGAGFSPIAAPVDGPHAGWLWFALRRQDRHICG